MTSLGESFLLERKVRHPHQVLVVKVVEVFQGLELVPIVVELELCVGLYLLPLKVLERAPPRTEPLIVVLITIADRHRQHRLLYLSQFYLWYF